MNRDFISSKVVTW